MPAAYDIDSKRFDELMAEVCPGARAEVNARIDKLRSEWAIQEMVRLKREPTISKHAAALFPAIFGK